MPESGLFGHSTQTDREVIAPAAGQLGSGPSRRSSEQGAKMIFEPGPRATFLGAPYMRGDEFVLWLSSSRASAKGASERAGMPYERKVVWFGSHGRGGRETCGA